MNDRPTWLQAIIDALSDALDRGIAFRGGMYYHHYGDPSEGQHCVVGYLADRAGVSTAVLEEAGGEYIDEDIAIQEGLVTQGRIKDTPAVGTIRQSIISHFDGDAPEAVKRFLFNLQMVNDTYQLDGPSTRRTEWCLRFARWWHPDRDLLLTDRCQAQELMHSIGGDES